MKLLAPRHWQDYELIDSGDFEKLERFGKYTLIRPEPQAIWKKAMDDAEWRKLADARYVRNAAKVKDGDAEQWTFYKKLPDSWTIRYQYREATIQLRLAFTSFGHVGVFPEQAENWDFLYDAITSWPKPGKVLNLFAYTGGASVVARAAGAEVTHVDAVKNMITWANENQQLSGLSNIRWVVEDALKFVQREAKRGHQYQGIILDPPAYGRGPNGEKWVLEEGLTELLQRCSQILAPANSFVVLNLYSMGLSSVVSANLARSFFPKGEMEFGEFYLPSKTGYQLPLGTFMRLKIQ